MILLILMIVLMNHLSACSSFDEFLDHLIGVDAFFRLGLELLDEFVSLVLSPLVPHGHQQLLQEITLKEA